MLEAQEAEEILDSLSSAQTEVLERVVMHKTSKQIGRELEIAPNTVDQRVKAAIAKLGATDRASAARRFVELNEICGRTIYASSVIDHLPSHPQSTGREQTHEAHFILRDAQFGFPVEYQASRATFLEAVDKRFGRIGRIGLIVALAMMLAILALIVTSIGATITELT